MMQFRRLFPAMIVLVWTTQILSSDPLAASSDSPSTDAIMTAAIDETTALAAIPLAILLAAFVAVLVARRTTRPARELAETLRAAGAAVDIPVRGHADAAQIARIVNRLTEQLRRQAEVLQHETRQRELAESQLRIALEASPAGALIVDARGRIVVVNEQFENMFGYEHGELLGQPIETLVPIDARSRHASQRSAYLSAPAARPMAEDREVFGIRKNGTEFPVGICLNPIDHDSGPAVMGVVVDVTDQRRAERQMRYFKAIIESSEDAIVGKDLSGVVTSWNRGAEQLYGYAAEEMIGQNIATIAPRDRIEEFDSILKRVARGERIDHFETARRHKDGRLIDTDISVSPIRDARGQVVGASAIARNITESKRMAAELEQCAEAVRASSQALQHFAQVALDNHRTMNSEQKSVSQMLARIFGDTVNEAAQNDINCIFERTDELARLIEKILEYSRAGRQTMTKQTINTEDLVADVVRSISVPPTVDIQVQGKLPAVQYDASQLRQVFENLVSNAIQHLGKPSGEIVISGRQFNRMIQFSIKDNGVGIPETQLDRIFGLFETSGQREAGKPAGIGLAIVVRIVERHGGRVQVLSRQGAGAEFVFTVPVSDAAVDARSTCESRTT
ncbi:MAG: PAS domain S-box protein [Phycisphaerales bacterium]|nr:PAS domain S-box protein [Phycisphaerales bacterium]MCB9863915.1 PAS domain S-box protein [Phycisphaerales bacterium]